jgi:hypothetical protein
MVCCGSKTLGTQCLATCGKLHPVCTTAADCPTGDTCHMEAAGFGICEHPHGDGGTSSGGDGGSSEGGDDGGGSDATTEGGSTDATTGG